MMKVFVRYKPGLYLTKTFVGERWYYCNLLCYIHEMLDFTTVIYVDTSSTEVHEMHTVLTTVQNAS